MCRFREEPAGLDKLFPSIARMVGGMVFFRKTREFRFIE